ncbi:(d)CMP kinase [Parvularcula sp. IMCC14364]|uniref:(d)CMP kinase n=1 Tax=Parvularcula sp. IMCC14364 TaxID=3067902 RepID=UPI002742312D|nr:(d)CMP kinase [Parvularcula sp. IMCC14364]
MKTENIVIAVDGPAASGKGTLSRRVASFYGLAYLDTGSLYRGVGWIMLSRGLSPRDVEDAEAAAQAFTLDQLDGADIRTPDVGRAASVVAAMPEVRDALLAFQRDFAAHPPSGLNGTVLDGRDIGTVVCPDATVKLFIDAAVDVRARRRWAELTQRDSSISFEQVLEDIKRRDQRDSSREAAPMKAAQDAHLIDTSELDIDAAFTVVRRAIDKTLMKSAMEG